MAGQANAVVVAEAGIDRGTAELGGGRVDLGLQRLGGLPRRRRRRRGGRDGFVSGRLFGDGRRRRTRLPRRRCRRPPVAGGAVGATACAWLIGRARRRRRLFGAVAGAPVSATVASGAAGATGRAPGGGVIGPRPAMAAAALRPRSPARRSLQWSWPRAARPIRRPLPAPEATCDDRDRRQAVEHHALEAAVRLADRAFAELAGRAGREADRLVSAPLPARHWAGSCRWSWSTRRPRSG